MLNLEEEVRVQTGPRVYSLEGSWLILHLRVLLKKEAVTNSVLHIPLLLFIKTQEQLGKGDEGLYI